jgi:transposase-like protein
MANQAIAAGLSRRKPHGQAAHPLDRVQTAGRSGYLGGETLYGLAKRHEISRTLIRVWLAKHEAGVLDSDTAAADMLADYEARIAALERLVGKLALENEFLKEVSRHARQARSASTSLIAGPLVSPSQKDAG